MKFIDEYGNIHKTEKELGRGGQGVVYLTKDKDVVIKEALKNKNIITDKTEIQKFHHLINNIIFKPIPSDIEIARPVALLKDKAGYIMKMLDGMNPIKELFSQELSKEEVDKLKDEIPKEKIIQCIQLQRKNLLGSNLLRVRQLVQQHQK